MTDGFIITKDTWDHMPTEQRDWILFETMQQMVQRCQVCDARITKLERPIANRLWAMAGGVVGGFAAWFSERMIRGG